MKSLSLLFFIAIIFVATAASAFCFDEAASEYDVPVDLLRAIARVESSMRVDALNWNNNGSYDFGVMQINSWWADRIGPELWRQLGDPCTNVRVGAWILAQCIERYDRTARAVGCYNSSSPTRQVVYARRVLSVLAKNNAATD